MMYLARSISFLVVAFACALGLAQGAAPAPTAPLRWGDFFAPRAPAPAPLATSATPHPAVARITVPERDGVAFGSGTLVDVEGEQGLVVTNWHVVRDAAGEIIVTFPDGFSSKAKVLRTDETWDLAALVIWKPLVAPAALAPTPPAPGEPLTIAGYGSGDFRAVTARCTQYVSPGVRYPPEMVEVGAQARAGGLGGPILNQRGELAGVLFGAAQGTTSGSYVGRVRSFLTPLSPRMADPNYVHAAQATTVASANPFAGNDGQLRGSPGPPATRAAVDPASAPAANTVAIGPPPPQLTAVEPSGGGGTAGGNDVKLTPVSPAIAVASVPKPSPRAAHVTFGTLPASDAGGPPPRTEEALADSQRQALWSRPLPNDPLPPPPGAAEATAAPATAGGNLWEAIFGKTPVEQGKSLLAAVALAGIVSRLMRTG